MAESLTIFDYCVILTVGISSFFAMSRGFMREASTLGAFVGGIAGAFLLYSYVSDPIQTALGRSTPGWIPVLIGAVIVFLVMYGVIAWFGAKLSQNVRNLEGFGLLDNLLGLIYGIVRGGVIVTIVILVIAVFIPEHELDPSITNAMTYPYFEFFADQIRIFASKWSENVSTTPLNNP